MKKSKQARALRVLFRELYKTVDRLNWVEERYRESQIENIVRGSTHCHCEIEEILSKYVLLEVRNTVIAYLGSRFMRVFKEISPIHAQVLIGKAIGNQNWMITPLADTDKYTTTITLVVSRVEWARFNKEIKPLLLLLSKKQKLPDEEYIRAARSIIKVLIRSWPFRA